MFIILKTDLFNNGFSTKVTFLEQLNLEKRQYPLHNGSDKGFKVTSVNLALNGPLK